MDTLAVVLQEPQKLALSRLELTPPGDGDLVVDVEWSGISSGTERLLWSGRMPHFPGMGYPLVPGYETVGRISWAGSSTSQKLGTRVFVPGASCYGTVRGLFGGAAKRVVLPEARVFALANSLEHHGILLALAATAYHAGFAEGARVPDLIIGHGALGRLFARIAVAKGNPPPIVWETNPMRASGAMGYSVLHPDQDQRRDYRAIYDVSGDAGLLDHLIGRLAPGGEICLAGFYSERLSFAFPPAFMKEARLRIAAQWQKADITAVSTLISDGRLSLDGLITHCDDAHAATGAYATAFEDPACLKMVLDWRSC